MKAVAIGVTTWRIEFLEQNWSLIGLFETLGLLSVKKTKNGLRKKARYIEIGEKPQTQHQPYLHHCFCMDTSHPKHPFLSWRDVLDAQKGVRNRSWTNAVGRHPPVSGRDGTGCVGQVCWRMACVHFFCSFHMIHECRMSAFSVVREEGWSGHLRSTSLSLPFVQQV